MNVRTLHAATRVRNRPRSNGSCNRKPCGSEQFVVDRALAVARQRQLERVHFRTARVVGIRIAIDCLAETQAGSFRNGEAFGLAVSAVQPNTDGRLGQRGNAARGHGARAANNARASEAVVHGPN
jgi:hypothetical protein